MRHPAVIAISIASFLLLMAVDLAFAETFKGGKINGENLLACGGQNAHPETDSFAGLGKRHYDEESRYWDGLRQQWAFCAGKYYPNTHKFHSEPAGLFLSGEYLPYLFTLLPGRDYTAGIIVPGIIAGIGFAGSLVNRPVSSSEKSDVDSPEVKEQAPSVDFMLGPAIAFGFQYRVLAAEFSAMAEAVPSVSLVSGKTSSTVYFSVGFGIYSVN
ncbi:MAG: hypothetical protein AB7T49_06525 [Oligoflexales bacterium]